MCARGRRRLRCRRKLRLDGALLLVGEQPAVADVHGAVGPGGHLGVVGDEHDGLSALLEAAEGLHHELSRRGVEVARGLVGEDDCRVVDEGARDGDALHLASGELIGAVEEVLLGKSHRAQGLPGQKLALARRDVGVDEREHHVSEHRGARHEVERLEHEAQARRAHVGQVVVRELGDLHALEAIRAGGRAVEAAERVHERRLAGARRPHDGKKLSARDLQRDAAQHGGEAGCGLVDAPEAADVDDGGGHGATPPRPLWRRVRRRRRPRTPRRPRRRPRRYRPRRNPSRLQLPWGHRPWARRR